MPIDRKKYETKLRWRSPNIMGQLMQSKYIIVSINDDEDIQKILIFFLKYPKYRYVKLFVEKEDVPTNENVIQTIVPRFGYFSRLLI